MGAAEFLSGKMAGHLAYLPTECQTNLFNTLSAFAVQYGECDLLLVSGYAGTGKTSAIAAFVRTLKELNYKYVLLAPTGRAAKVLSGFTGEKASTIHKHIYRQKSLSGGLGEFTLNINKAKDTFFIVDEASLISTTNAIMRDTVFGSGDLLSDLISFVRAGVDNKLILIGDKGQLPPIGMECSPALDESYMSQFGNLMTADLTSVVRQAVESGILTNATIVRNVIAGGIPDSLRLRLEGFTDIERITGGDLIETLSEAVGRYGLDNIVVLCRSNKRANRYNEGIRSTVLFREEQLTRGDKLMVVKNCYQFLDDVPGLDFIANGDVAELKKISHYEERYGLNFAEARLSFPDYDDIEITARIILDTLKSESPSLTAEQSKALFEGVNADYADEKNARKRYKKVREDQYYNALQIKYATAITCHKSQGGQWDCVFIDNPFWKELEIEDFKWLYTAITRGVKKVYLVNFKDEYFQ